ncbi:FecR domain-containing protein [Planctomicrobium sp. SH661]|uniref:FecR domain-containing protein n=1 Tax=Planctomicrobium sp. SH661 TaxID=3448124 RepID=UPI003F5C544D
MRSPIAEEGGPVMESPSSRNEEVRQLTDAMFDGQSDAHRMQRLESLVLGDLGCLQTYVERINFHGVIFQRARNRSPEESAIDVLQEFARAVQLRDRKERNWWYWFTGTLVTSVVAVVTWGAFHAGAFRPAPLGMISSLSANVRSGSAPVELGRIVRRGESITVSEGILSLELPHVMVDVLGPATFRLDDAAQLTLSNGAIVAKVFDQGQGFTVKTPEAVVVDYGTEFLVEHRPGEGTGVSVRQGRVKASLLDRTGLPTQMLELTDNRAAQFPATTESAREVAFEPNAFLRKDRSRGDIRSIDGMLRTSTTSPETVASGQVLTPNHILVIPEKQNVVLQKDLVLNDLHGLRRLSAGSIVSSYLIHYDPPEDISRAPRGAVTFWTEVAAVVVTPPELAATDSLFGLPGLQFDQEETRGLELGLDEDKVQVSKDRRTVSFHFDMSPPKYLDEVRVLIVTGRASNSGN